MAATPSITVAERAPRTHRRARRLLTVVAAAVAGALVLGLWSTAGTPAAVALAAAEASVVTVLLVARVRRRRRRAALAVALLALEHQARAMRLRDEPLELRALLVPLTACLELGASAWSIRRAVEGDAPCPDDW